MAAADHGEEAAAGGEVLHGLLEMGGEMVDAICEDGDLDIRGAGVFLVQAVPCNDLTFRCRGHKVIGYRMTNRRGVNVLGLVQKGRWKAGRGKFGDCRWKMGGWVAVLLVAASLAVAQEAGWKTDLEKLGFEVPIEDLEKGEIVGQKWMVQGAGPGFLGARAFFLATGEPEKVAGAVLEFDPTKGRTLAWTEEGSVKIYEAFPRPPAPEAWNRFREALGKTPFDLLLQVEGRKEGRVHLHPAEIQKVSSAKINGWIEVLQFCIYHLITHSAHLLLLVLYHTLILTPNDTRVKQRVT